MSDPTRIPPIRLTHLSHGGGCGCKIAPAVLETILADTPFAKGLASSFPDLLVGTESSDDAAVWKLNESQAIVATTDFFMPIVDDPYEFGRIAATNAISDVYAMGGRPLFALALVGMPLDKLAPETIRAILAGGEAAAREAGIPVAGGHSIDSQEPIYGLVAIGVVDPRRVKKNSAGQAGDVLILGKGLGVGIYSAALKKDCLPAAGYRAMIDSTTRLNTPGTELGGLDEVHAMTDVTGFGLLGHALELAPRRSRLRHRRERTQLGQLRRRRGVVRRLRRLAESRAHRSADQRRPHGGLRCGCGGDGNGRVPPAWLHTGGSDRRPGSGAGARAGGGVARQAPRVEHGLTPAWRH